MKQWRRRGSIPPEYWLEIERAARRRGIDGVTVFALAEMAEATLQQVVQAAQVRFRVIHSILARGHTAVGLAVPQLWVMQTLRGLLLELGMGVFLNGVSNYPGD